MSNALKYGHRLIFNVYYHKSVDFLKSGSIKEVKSRREYLTPYFQTKEGVIQLSNDSYPIVDCSENLITTELTKKEPRKYESNPDLFKN